MNENEVILELMKLKSIYSLLKNEYVVEALDYAINKIRPEKKTMVKNTDMVSLTDERNYDIYLWSQIFEKYTLTDIINKTCTSYKHFTVTLKSTMDTTLCNTPGYKDCEMQVHEIIRTIVSKYRRNKYMEPIKITCDATELTMESVVDICEGLPEDAAYVVKLIPGEKTYPEYNKAVDICNLYLAWKSNKSKSEWKVTEEEKQELEKFN